MPIYKKQLLGWLLILLATHSSIAQSNQVGNWLVYLGNQQLNKKWNIQSDVQYRNYQIFTQPNQFLIRAGLGYNIKEQNQNLLLGFAYIKTNTYDVLDQYKNSNIEQRVYQQYLYKQKWHQNFLTHRVRLEERFFPHEFALRGRYFLSLNRPFKGKVLAKNIGYWSSYNELFIDLKNMQFDRNRFYAGVGYGIAENIRIESGYMLQSQKNITRGQLQLILINNLSLK